MKLIIDAMGGDNAPLEIVKGALSGQKRWGVDVTLTGDTTAILQQALVSGKRLCVPRCLPGNDGRMELVEITSLNDLQPGRYGILEPCGGRTIAALELGALALIPCLAVDKQGVRLGRGAGYYDRFLTRFGQTGPKLLLCPEALVFPALPTDEWDVPFTPGEILTENGVK